MAIIHNKTIGSLIEDHYSIHQYNQIYNLLIKQGTFDFHKLQNGLFPAANVQAKAEYTGYRYVWVRDNIYVAFAHQLEGRSSIAVENVKTLARYFLKHKSRFEAIIDGTADFNDPMNRPHVRFNGGNLFKKKTRNGRMHKTMLWATLCGFSACCTIAGSARFRKKKKNS